ncbi:Fic family protein [Agromyces sp. H3Y2-19a]|uniref:type II toxin-antitoxin system death-on-curing family toxin n=1 Tax=Agromyces TaxID=33877 RepID=UPI001E2B5A34|nr:MULTISPECIES: Fic family protein [Agromyces]MCD5345819.1 Fic family protein [Agromyces sp. S2-1-8]MDF0512184.1 Fic family protein [Agromyces chromiiresistens]
MTEYVEPADVEEWLASRGFHVRDRGLLLSALAAPMPVFGEEVHPGLHEKAAVLLIGLSRNHPLFDGNKRLSWLVTAVFYELNGFDLVEPEPRAIDRFVRAVAAGAVGRDEAIAWLEARAAPFD